MHVSTISCQVFLKEKSLTCEGFVTALPCLTQPLVCCIAIDLDSFVIIQMLLFIFFVC